MSDSDSDLSSAPASPRESRVTPAAGPTPIVEAGPSSAASPPATSTSTGQSKKRSSAAPPAALTRVPSGRAKRTRQVYSPSEGSSSRRSSIVPPSKPASSAPTPPAETAPTPPTTSAPTPPGPQTDVTDAKTSAAGSAAGKKAASAVARPRGKKRKSDEAVSSTEDSPTTDAAKSAVPKLKLKLGAAGKAPSATPDAGLDEYTTETKKAKKAKKVHAKDVSAGEAPAIEQKTIGLEHFDSGDAASQAKASSASSTKARKDPGKGSMMPQDAETAKGGAKRSVAKKKKKMVIDSEDGDDGDDDATPGAESVAAEEKPAAAAGGGTAKKRDKKLHRKEDREHLAEDGNAGIVPAQVEAADAAGAADTPANDGADKPVKAKKAVKRDTPADDTKDEAQENADGTDVTTGAPVPGGTKREKDSKHDTPARPPKTVAGAAAKPTPNPSDLAFRKKKPVPKAPGTKGTPGAKASPAPAAGPAATLLSQTLAALSNKGTPSKPPTKQDKKDVPTPGTADWRAEYTLSQSARDEYEASAAQRAKEKAERARWKLNAVHLQESKDIYKLDSDPTTLHERQIHLPDGSQIGIKTRAVDVIKALWAKQDEGRAASAA